MGSTVKIALTIAASDSSSGAGIQADLRVFSDLGIYGTSSVTAVTAQNSQGVHKINKVPPRIVAAQIDAVVRDIGVDACKIGMLFSEQVVSLVAERIDRRKIPNVVLDPVFFAKDGTRLLHAQAIKRLKRQLIPRCTLVTPNLTEATEISKIEIKSLEDAKKAARFFTEKLGAKNVLIKGGHLEGEPIDLLFDGKEFIEYKGKRISDKSMHGTGCVLSAAIAARLAFGDSIQDAVKYAKDYVSEAISNSIKLGKGEMWYFKGTNP